MKKEEKQKQAEELREHFQKAKILILSGFEGLTVAQDSELRRRIGQVGSRYQVAKNSLIERAAPGTAVEPIATRLRGTTSVAYTEADPVALARVLTAYAKENPALVFKAGVVEGRVVSVADLSSIASLPSREVLLATALSMFNSPARRLVSTLAAVARNLAYVIQQGVEQGKFKEA
jgi:large subunit ribosomal protein L10